jgi:cell division cycle 2-like protein
MSKWDAYSSSDEDEQPKLKSSKNSFSDVSIEQKDEKPSKKIRTEDEVIGEVSMHSIMESKTDSIGREMSASSHETRSSVDAFTPATLTKIERPYNPIFDGCRSVECYQRLNFIDQGTYGMVFRAKCKVTNEVYALKQVKLGADANKLV